MKMYLVNEKENSIEKKKFGLIGCAGSDSIDAINTSNYANKSCLRY